MQLDHPLWLLIRHLLTDVPGCDSMSGPLSSLLDLSHLIAVTRSSLRSSLRFNLHVEGAASGQSLQSSGWWWWLVIGWGIRPKYLTVGWLDGSSVVVRAHRYWAVVGKRWDNKSMTYLKLNKTLNKTTLPTKILRGNLKLLRGGFKWAARPRCRAP